MIAARVRQDIIVAKEGTIFKIPEARLVNAEGIVEGEEVTDCICHRPADGGVPLPMLDCDRCHRWFHCECVGVDQFNTPNAWFCDQCRILKQLNLQEVGRSISILTNRLTMNLSPHQVKTSLPSVKISLWT